MYADREDGNFDDDKRVDDQLVASSSTPRRSRNMSCRHILAFVAFLGFVNVYCLRVNLSVALVAMVNQTSEAAENVSSTDCPVEVHNITVGRGGEMNWNSHKQAQVLAAFFYGYIGTQIPGGWLAGRYGGKMVFGIGILCTSLLTLLTPLAARWHVNALLALRVLEGIGEGVTFPAMHTLFARWAPQSERSSAVTFVYAGCQLGTVIGMPLSGVLCDHGFAGGWPSVFYVFGIAGCAWSILWFTVCYDTPSSHPYILSAERDYIESTTIAAQPRSASIPWRKILTSIPVWACVTVHFTNNWGYYTLLTCLPKYMNDVLHFDIKSNGFLSGLPYLACWILMTASGQVADCLRVPGRLSTIAVRKICCFIGLMFPAAFLIASGFMGCDRVGIVIVLICAVGFSGVAQSCYGVNQLDLSPIHAGALMGLANMFATIPGFAGPAVVGALTYHQSTRVEWQSIFYIAGGMYCFGTIVFLIFGSGELQPWATKLHEKIDEDTISEGDQRPLIQDIDQSS